MKVKTKQATSKITKGLTLTWLLITLMAMASLLITVSNLFFSETNSLVITEHNRLLLLVESIFLSAGIVVSILSITTVILKK